MCDGMSLVKTLVKMAQGDRLQNSNRIVIAAVTGRPAAPTSQERGRSYCMHLWDATSSKLGMVDRHDSKIRMQGQGSKPEWTTG